MSIPDWYEILLLALASWRIFDLLAEDAILDRPRRYVTRRREKLTDFVECPYCLGFWIGVAWWVSFQLWEHGTLVATVPFAISAVVIGTHKILSPSE